MTYNQKFWYEHCLRHSLSIRFNHSILKANYIVSHGPHLAGKQLKALCKSNTALPNWENMYSRDSPDPHPTKSTDTDSRYYQQKFRKEVSLGRRKQLTILRMVLLKVSSRSNPCSNGSDPSDLLDEGEEKARLLAEEGFKVSILKSEPRLEKPLKGFLARWNSIFLKTAEAEEDETAARDPSWPVWISIHGIQRNRRSTR